MGDDAGTVATPLDDYELIDFGRGRKLERLGSWLVESNAPGADGPRARAQWSPDWSFSDRVGAKEWLPARAGLPREWPIRVDGLTYHVTLSDDGKTGFAPDLVLCARWLRRRFRDCEHLVGPRALMLFGANGAAAMAARDAGVQAIQVDPAQDTLRLAARNLDDESVRLVHSDVSSFVEQQIRQGERYHFVALRPPALARGARASWDIKCDLNPLIRALPRIVPPDLRGVWFALDHFEWTAESLGQMLRGALPGRSIDTMELAVATADGRRLVTGVGSILYDDSEAYVSSGEPLPLSALQIEERLDVYLDAALSSRRTAVAPANEISKLDRPQQEYALEWVHIIAESNAELAFQFANNVARAYALMDQDTIAAWTMSAVDIFDETGLHNAVAALQAVDAFARQAAARRSGLALDEVVRVLEHFVHGLNGRELSIDTAGTQYTDTETLFLPDMLTRFEGREDNFRLYKAMAVNMWAQTWYGTWREATLERLRVFPEPARAARLYHCLETLRLDACIARELPGLHRDMRILREGLGETFPFAGWETYAERLAEPRATVDTSLELLAQVYGEPVPASLCYQGTVLPDEVQKTRDLRIAREKRLFRHVLAKLADELQEQEPAAEDERKPQAPRFGTQQRPDPQQSEGFSVELTLDGKPLAPPEGVESLMDSILQDLGTLPDDYLVPAGDGGYAFSGEAAEVDPNDVWKGTYHEEGAMLYNEWDYERQNYRKNWCVLRELEVHPGEEDFVRKTLLKYGGLVKSLRNTFELLRGEDKLLKKQPFGDDVDIDAFVEAVGDVAGGMEMTDRLFTKMHKLDRNIAVMFMVDMSGSTKGWINDAERESLVLLCEALETLGDRYAIYGFSGMSRKRCELYRIKRFDEPYDDDVRARISGIKPHDYTRMGVSIRHLTKLLTAIEARTRVLITLSDGKPDDYDRYYRGMYGIEDTRQALIEARREGIHPFCITIDKEGHDYLPHMYGPVNYTVIEEVSRLPLRVSDIYRKLTT